MKRVSIVIFGILLWMSIETDWLYSSGDIIGVLPLLGCLVIVFVVIRELNRKKNTKKNNYNYNYKQSTNKIVYEEDNKVKVIEYNDVDIDTLKKVLPGYELYTLKKELFNTFVSVHSAWMTLDYTTLRNLCSPELFNYYVCQLEGLRSDNCKNVVSNLEDLDCKIIDIKNIYNNTFVTMYLNVTYYDYVVSTLNNCVIRGNANYKVNNKYLLTFVKKGKGNISNCPNCGAVVKDEECMYCGTKVTGGTGKFILNKKVTIRK